MSLAVVAGVAIGVGILLYVARLVRTAIPRGAMSLLWRSVRRS